MEISSWKIRPPVLCSDVSKGVFVCVALLIALYGLSPFADQNCAFAQPVHIPTQSSYPTIKGLNPLVPIRQYVSTVYQAQNGLPQNSAYCLHQTRDGYLWIGTEEGASRFDGVQFTTFDKDAFIGLSVVYTISFCEQRDGTFWMGTRGGSLIRYMQGKYTLFDSTKGLFATDIWTMLEDRAGTLWIGTENGLFAYSSGKIHRFSKEHGLPHLIVYSLHQDRLGTLWVGTQEGLCRFTGDFSLKNLVQQNGVPVKSFTLERLPNNDTTDVRAVFHDSKGTLHVGTRTGLWSRTGNASWRHLTQKDGLSGNYIYDILEDRAGSLWIATFDKGISRIIGSQIEAYSRAGGLANENTLSLLEDREGAVWVGTYGGGIQRFMNGTCLNMTKRDGLVDEVVRSFCHDSTGGFWIGLNNKGLQRLQNGKLTLFDKTTTRTFAGEEIRGLFTSPDGTVWVGVLGAGVYFYKNGKWGHYSEKDGLASNDVYSMAIDRDGTMWFGGSQKGISRLQNGKFTTLTMRDGLLNESVYGLMTDSSGGLWIGSFGGGVQYYRGGRFTNYSVQQGLLGMNILTFHADKQGAVWVGGVGGISRIKNGIVKSFTKKEGLFDESAFTILEDDNGYLWASCNKGVYCFRKAQADSVADGLLKKIVCRNFGTADGMKNVECNGGAQPSAIKAKDGRLWFSTIESAVMIDPKRLEINALPPPVIIEAAHVDSLELNLQEARVVEPSRNNIQFTYTATTLHSAARITFRYLLEGFDRDWIEAGSRRIAYYTNLPRGRSYRFRVQACNHDGVWNDVGASYSFSVESFFYETWWFIALCVLAGAVLILAAYRLRVRQIQVRTEELERLVQERTKRLQDSNVELAAANSEVYRQMQLTDSQAREIEITNSQLQENNALMRQLIEEKNEFLGIAAHDLKNPLSSIIMTISMMRRYNEKIDVRSLANYLQRIESTAERMLKTITDLLNINEIESGQVRLHIETVNFSELAADAAQHYHIIAQRKEISFVLELTDTPIPVKADKERLWEVLENLLSNAIKFSPPQNRVFVRLRTMGARVRFEVQDEGPGLDESDRARLFQKFARLSAKPTGGEHSTGLGLSIVKKMIEAMGGEVWCESELGKGATFIIELPKV
ncbi:MAG: ATP-binding protein [Candidatus Kapabacteria bacterium]|jgi:signal transduction histidine kinase/ligand-binding sensor domain-containing protein|nr:ATP-binding protein [Candidatus Kapabacteria bacterium]